MAGSRLLAFRTTAFIAVGFVVLRVVYRVLFGGGSGDGLLLVDLPTVPLGGPFAGILLFGPVTTGGIATAALSALPFAALILLLGLIGLVVDLRALLVRGSQRGPLRTISRTLVIALSTSPALRAAVSRVRVARELRGERSVASLLVPVLEQTVERAIALGASMELRGFAATRHPDLDRSRPAELIDAALGYEGGWVLDPIDLTLAPGTLTLVTGATGSGKSTLLDAMSGLFQHVSEGRQDGTVEVGGLDRSTVPPRETAGFIGVVPQAVRLSFVAPTVSEELGFGPAMQGLAPDAAAARVADVATELGIAQLLDRAIGELSAGEACLVAIGAAVVSGPGLLLLDEPLADLDDAARERVVEVLTHLVHDRGMCVVVAEHSPHAWGAAPDRRIELRDGTIAVGEPPASTASEPDPATAPRRSPSDAPLGRLRGLTARHGATIAVDSVDLDVRAGEVTALLGPNGAGKSSLFMEWARPSTRGTVLVDGVDVAGLSRRARRSAVALVPEAFDDLLFATSVSAECARADRLAVAPGAEALFLSLLGIERAGSRRAPIHLLDRHPRDLSAGQRLCLVIAIQLTARPRVLLIDEPTRGLDAAARSMVGAAIARVAAEGTAVVVATHDRDFAARVATRTVRMDRGRITETVDAVAP